MYDTKISNKNQREIDGRGHKLTGVCVVASHVMFTDARLQVQVILVLFVEMSVLVTVVKRLRGFRVCPHATATATQNGSRKTDKRHTERFDPVEGHKAGNALDEDVQGNANQNNGASIRHQLPPLWPFQPERGLLAVAIPVDGMWGSRLLAAVEVIGRGLIIASCV